MIGPPVKEPRQLVQSLTSESNAGEERLELLEDVEHEGERVPIAPLLRKARTLYEIRYSLNRVWIAIHK